MPVLTPGYKNTVGTRNLPCASVVTDMSPLMKWSLALIAGGGIAGLIQAATVALRGTSSVTTGGTANFAVATGELIMALITTLLAIVLPIVASALVLGILIWVVLRLSRRRRSRPQGFAPPAKSA